MEIQELSVGDWVTSCEVTTRIEGIHKDTVDLKEVKGVRISTLDPVLLTAQILMENGFIDYEGPRCTIFFTSDFGRRISLCDVGDGFAVREWGIKIRFVHELQHVLRLAKIKKEIQ